MSHLQQSIQKIVTEAHFYGESESAEASAHNVKQNADTITQVECEAAKKESGSTDLVEIAEWVVSTRVGETVNINRRLLRR